MKNGLYFFILVLVLMLMLFSSYDRSGEKIENNTPPKQAVNEHSTQENNTNTETEVHTERPGDGIMEDYPFEEDISDASVAYKDFEYRTEYANLLNFDALEGNPHFAIAFIGYNRINITEIRKEVIAKIFPTLDEKAIEKIKHFDFEGDEWYLIVPRYKEYVDVKSLDDGKIYTSYNGDPFTVKCNASDLYSNIEIVTDIHGGHSFSPQIGGNGRIIKNEDIWDMTFYYDR